MDNPDHASDGTDELRSRIYGFFASAFASPAEGHFPSIEQINDYRTLVGILCAGSIGLADELMAAAGKNEHETLLVEHTRLFVGPFHLPAPLYGSVYLERSGSMMGESTIEVREFYQNAGLKYNDGFDELPDHICVELEFMQYLCASQASAFSNGDVESALEFRIMQSTFLEKYLLPWMPDLSSRIQQNTDNSFYAALATNFLKFSEYEKRLPRVSGEPS